MVGIRGRQTSRTESSLDKLVPSFPLLLLKKQINEGHPRWITWPSKPTSRGYEQKPSTRNKSQKQRIHTLLIHVFQSRDGQFRLLGLGTSGIYILMFGGAHFHEEYTGSGLSRCTHDARHCRKPREAVRDFTGTPCLPQQGGERRRGQEQIQHSDPGHRSCGAQKA